jgi:hypothetical protein
LQEAFNIFGSKVKLLHCNWFKGEAAIDVSCGFRAATACPTQTEFEAAFPLPNADLPVSGYVIVRESYLIAYLHLVEQPVGIALKDFREVHSNVAGRLAESVHDPAQGSFVNAKHFGQTVLPDACRVHPQLQIRVNISIQGQGVSLVFNPAAGLSLEEYERLLMSKCPAILAPNHKPLCCQHLVSGTRLGSSQKLSTVPELYEWVLKLTKRKGIQGKSRRVL